MSTNEKDRLDLRQAFEELFADKRIADIAMNAMPPIDYATLATKTDLGVTAAELRGEMAELRGEFVELRGEFAGLRGEFAGLRGEFAELRGEVRGDIARLEAKIESSAAGNLRVMLLSQLTTTVMLGGYVTAVLG